MDNGERVPWKKPLVNIVIDEEQRIFKGDIVWEPTSWEGDTVWRYGMHFSVNFDRNISGKIQVFNLNQDFVGTPTFEHSFVEIFEELGLAYKRHGSHDLVIQTAFEDTQGLFNK